MLDTTIIESNWRSRGFSFELWEDPQVKFGRILTMGNKTLKPAIGEEVLIPAGVDHTVQTSSTTGSRWYYGYKVRR